MVFVEKGTAILAWDVAVCVAALVLGAEQFLLVGFCLLHRQLTAGNLHLKFPRYLLVGVPGDGQNEVPGLLSVLHRS